MKPPNETVEEQVESATRPSNTCPPNSSRHEHSIDLNDRSCIDTSSPKNVVADAERDYRPGDEDSVIHVLSRDRQL